MPTQEMTPLPVARKGYGSDRTERPCANPTGGEPGQAAHPAVTFLRLLGKDPAQTYFRTIQPGTWPKCIKGFDPAALARANAIRVKRAGLKRDLKAGDRRLADILQRPAEWVLTAKVHDLLLCVPGVGAVKAAKMLQQCRVSGSKTVGGLSDRQRSELIALLSK